jgi:hypothetical protein
VLPTVRTDSTCSVWRPKLKFQDEPEWVVYLDCLSQCGKQVKKQHDTDMFIVNSIGYVFDTTQQSALPNGNVKFACPS